MLLAVGAQAVLVLSAPVLPAHGIDPLRYVLPLTTGAICVWAALNRALPGMWLVLAGAACNLAVISANGGLMPTNAAALAGAGKYESIERSRAHPGVRLTNSKDVLLASEETLLPWLSDFIVTPPLPQRKVMSVGDLIIAAGLAYLAVQATRAPLTSGALRTARAAQTSRPAHAPLALPALHSTIQEDKHDASDTIARTTTGAHFPVSPLGEHVAPAAPIGRKRVMV